MFYFYDVFPNYNRYKVPMWSQMKEDKKSSRIEIAIPGYEKEDFFIELREGGLFLVIDQEERSISYSLLDSFYVNAYDIESAKATYKNGILTVEIPKKSVNSKKIEVT